MLVKVVGENVAECVTSHSGRLLISWATTPAMATTRGSAKVFILIKILLDDNVGIKAFVKYNNGGSLLVLSVEAVEEVITEGVGISESLCHLCGRTSLYADAHHLEI